MYTSCILITLNNCTPIDRNLFLYKQTYTLARTYTRIYYYMHMPAETHFRNTIVPRHYCFYSIEILYEKR